ncbi:hypothetical protein [Nocardia brasiliensis]|uniref:hypothetical protein n=1 Tax=Nocardia brasiliensis TaxID=37326 RepID=UPI00366B44A8
MKTRPYDPQLYTDLIKATKYAVTLPKTMTTLTYGLDVTAGLAGSVARNADAATLAALITDAAGAQPLATAVQLLRELMFVAEETSRSDLANTAQQHASRLLLDTEWAVYEMWVDNRHHIRSLLNLTASLTSDTEVLDMVEKTLTADPSLLGPILKGVSEYREQRRLTDMSQLIGTKQDAVWRRTEASNELRSLLREYYPAFLDTFAARTTKSAPTSPNPKPAPSWPSHPLLPTPPNSPRPASPQHYAEQAANAVSITWPPTYSTACAPRNYANHHWCKTLWATRHSPCWPLSTPPAAAPTTSSTPPQNNSANIPTTTSSPAFPAWPTSPAHEYSPKSATTETDSQTPER